MLVKSQFGSKRRKLVFWILLLSLVGCSNLFENMAEKDFDKAIFYEAQRDLKNSDYDDAIDKIINDLSSAYQRKRTVRFVLAQAYAGSCGLDFLTMIDNIQNGAGNVLPLFMASMTGVTAADIDDCTNALTTLDKIGAIADRTANENLLTLFISMAKLGAVMSVFGDTDDDGTEDVGFDPCDNTDLPQANVDAGVSAFAHLITSTNALVNQGQDVGGSTVTDILTYCAQIDAIDPSYNLCTQLDESTVTSEHRVVLRCFIDGPDIGFDISGNSLAVCIDHVNGNVLCPGP